MGNSASAISSDAVLQEYFERKLKRSPLAPREPPRTRLRADDGDDDDLPQKPLGGLPPPADQDDVDTIGKLAEACKAQLASARTKLENTGTPLPADVDWEVTLYMLFLAWIVNYGRDPSVIDANSLSYRKARKTDPIKYDKQNQELVHAAAAHLNVEWHDFIDLALAPHLINPEEEDPEKQKRISGPFAGVFVHKGANPYMVLAFKGTTYALEVATDTVLRAVGFNTPDNDVLYGNICHKGMGIGLFDTFSDVGETQAAFDTIYEGLNRVAAELKGNSDRKIPLYVTGHSLGAGYCTIAYKDLTRRVADEPPASFVLSDCWNYGSPRVFVNAGAKKLKEVLAATNRHCHRHARRYDLVPNLPATDDVGHYYKHVDVGYRLTPAETQFWNVRKSEIDTVQFNDGFPLDDNWKFHWPSVYFEAVKKILDNPTPLTQKK